MLHPRIALKARPIAGSRLNGRFNSHNAIVDRYYADNGMTINGAATGILALATGLADFCEYHDSANPRESDQYVREYILEPMIEAFRNALNLDLGGLDGGTLSGWVEGLAAEYGIED